MCVFFLGGCSQKASQPLYIYNIGDVSFPGSVSQGFPVIFQGVTGIDDREASSPSFFNIAEVELLMDYVKKLLQTHGKRGLATISPSDIGIIAPYRKQVSCRPTRDHFQLLIGYWLRFIIYVDYKLGLFCSGYHSGAENPQGPRQSWARP